jgi:MYXO-CTERM domain-containing protein
MTKGILISLCGLIAAGTARADVITTYTSRAAWAAALSGVQTIDFGTLSPPANGFNTYLTPPGLTVDGVNFSDTAKNAIFVEDKGYCCPTYNRGFDSLSSNFSTRTGIVVTLPGGTTGAGFNLWGLTLGDTTGALPGVIDVMVAGNTYVVNTPTFSSNPNSVFFGFVDSTGPVANFTFTPGLGTDQANAMNFAFGKTTSSVVPEPRYGWLTLAGGLLIFVWRRRRAFRPL